jgi:predicted AAA+ superfamily ATPase
MPEYHVLGAGSLLGVKLAHTKGFPVGKVEFLDMYPLTFLEFLSAIGKPMLKEFLSTKTDASPISEPIHEELLSLLKFYLIVGGMPEAVAQFAANQNDLQSVREIQKGILNAYILDFAKHAPPSQNMKITTVWNAVPAQLSKENKKFIFSVINENARAREYEEAIQWLEDAGLILKAYHMTVPKFPAEGYIESKAFKVYHLDVGLLGAMSYLPPKIILEGHSLFTEFKGALTENLVAQALATLFEKRLFYWSIGPEAEVDFILPIDTEFLPLEVKSGKNKWKKSLRLYVEKFQPRLRLRTSPMNYHHHDAFLNIPLYAIQAYLKSLSQQ